MEDLALQAIKVGTPSAAFIVFIWIFKKELKGVLRRFGGKNSITKKHQDTADRIEGKVQKMLSNDLTHIEQSLSELDKLDTIISLLEQSNRTLDRTENKIGEHEKVLQEVRRLVNGG